MYRCLNLIDSRPEPQWAGQIVVFGREAAALQAFQVEHLTMDRLGVCMMQDPHSHQINNYNSTDTGARSHGRFGVGPQIDGRMYMKQE